MEGNCKNFMKEKIFEINYLANRPIFLVIWHIYQIWDEVIL